jgi:Fur family ferric uptake transcriptional regulator
VSETIAASSWADHARSVLAHAGHQRGGARDAVIDVLAEQSCALSALEIEERLRGVRRTVGRASVYRAIELLQSHGLILRLDLGDATSRFEIVDPAGGHHHHLVCDSCGSLVPFDDADLERSIDRLSRRLGFSAKGHEVVLRGDCAACRN